MLLQSPPLPLEPLRRLQASNNLLITAERWRVAHEYHRKRHTIHYQSLHQAGIVWGLGVCLISPPDTVELKKRELPWLQIQPGLAIDQSGNPIVVPEPIDFPIASTAPETGPLTVYVTIRHSDPDRRQEPGDRDIVQECVRIDEIVTPPTDGPIELCRMRLQPGAVHLEPSLDVLNPGVNQLDLRYRPQAQVRALHQVGIAYVVSEQLSEQPMAAIATNEIATNLLYLLQSLAALYPSMQGELLAPVMLSIEKSGSFDADLLYFTYAQWVGLLEAETSVLQNWLATGTTVIVEISAQEAGIGELGRERQRLQSAIAILSADPESEDAQQSDLEAELVAVEANISERAHETALTIRKVAQRLGVPMETTGVLDHTHPLRTTPFLFAQLPVLNQQPIHLYHWGGIVVVIGSLSQSWGLDGPLARSRETIRTAHEMGINLLQFAWRRKQLTQLQYQST